MPVTWRHGHHGPPSASHANAVFRAAASLIFMYIQDSLRLGAGGHASRRRGARPGLKFRRAAAQIGGTRRAPQGEQCKAGRSDSGKPATMSDQRKKRPALRPALRLLRGKNLKAVPGWRVSLQDIMTRQDAMNLQDQDVWRWLAAARGVEPRAPLAPNLSGTDRFEMQAPALGPDTQYANFSGYPDGCWTWRGPSPKWQQKPRKPLRRLPDRKSHTATSSCSCLARLGRTGLYAGAMFDAGKLMRVGFFDFDLDQNPRSAR